MGEQRWVLAVVGRCLGYGVRMGLTFLLIGLGISIILRLISMVLVMAGWYFLLDFEVTLLLSCGLIGALGGVVAGFYSPPRETDAKFFERVLKSGRNWLIYGACAGLATTFLLEAITIFVSRYTGAGPLPILLLAWVGQIFGIWRGINLARRTGE